MWYFGLVSLFSLLFLAGEGSAQTLPGTKPLAMKGDPARQMLDGIDRYLTRATAASVVQRKDYWKPDYSSAGAYARSVQPNRDRFKKIIGAVDARSPIKELEYVGGTSQEAVVAQTKKYTVYAVRWPVLPGVYGEGLLLEPKGKPKACMVVIPGGVA